jgi:hypothetical protein
MKHHMRSVIANQALSFEEMTTALTQIEACLNSRPLTPLSNDSDDVQILTLRNFLIGTCLLAPPDQNVLDIKSNRPTHWQLVQQMVQRLWKIWSTDYLHLLQQRPKWKLQVPNIQIGDVVNTKEDNVPPLVWKMAVVSNLHPGHDGIVGVVILRTAKGTLKRPITKICVLSEVH